MSDKRLTQWLARLALPALVLFAWWIAALLNDPLLVPSPADTGRSLAGLASSGELWTELGISLERVALGVALGALFGIPFGVLVGTSAAANRYLGSALPAISATSSAIWSVLGILWFGLSDFATVFVVAMTATPMFAVNARDAVRAVDADLIQMAQSLGFGWPAICVKVIAPSVLPSVFAASRLAIGFGWRVGLVAEALGSPSGVGFRLKQAVDLMRTAEVFAWSVAVIAVMLLVEIALLNPLESRRFRWRKTVSAT